MVWIHVMYKHTHDYIYTYIKKWQIFYFIYSKKYHTPATTLIGPHHSKPRNKYKNSILYMHFFRGFEWSGPINVVAGTEYFLLLLIGLCIYAFLAGLYGNIWYRFLHSFVISISKHYHRQYAAQKAWLSLYNNCSLSIYIHIYIWVLTPYIRTLRC
jgi:hypothetical protein